MPAVDDPKVKVGKATELTAKRPKGGKPSGEKPTKPRSNGPKAAAHHAGNGRGHAGERK